MGEWKKEENLTNDTPPKKWFWTPFVWYAFHPPRASLLFFLVKKWKTDQTRRSFRGVQKFSGECVVRYVFLSPYVLHPPMSWPNIGKKKPYTALLQCRIFFAEKNGVRRGKISVVDMVCLVFMGLFVSTTGLEIFL